MLQELYIENFTLIEKAHIEFTEGFNVLTGETGAGKSILIDAMGILLGGRASSDFIRTGCNKAIIQGVFSILDKLNRNHFEIILDSIGIIPEEDGIIIMLREISDNGRNICRINGRTVTLSNFQHLAKNLVEIHGQNSNQQLLSMKKQEELLDRIGGEQIQSIREELYHTYKLINNLEKEKNLYNEIIKNGIKEKDFLIYQIEEITEANLNPDEEEELERELNILSNSQELQTACLEANNLLFSGTPSAYDQIGHILERFRKLKGLKEDLDQLLIELDSIMYQIQDIAIQMKDIAQMNENFQPERIQFIEDRIALINKLKRKYGSDINNILKIKKKLEIELEELNNAEKHLTEIEASLEANNKKYMEMSNKIHKLRKNRRGRTRRKRFACLKRLGNAGC